MSFLFIVALVAATFAAIALIGGIFTIVLHAIRQARELTNRQVTEQLTRDILQELEKPEWSPDLVETMRRNRRLGADLFSDLSELIRGENRERLRELCRQAGIDRWLMKRAVSHRTERRRDAVDMLRLFPSEETIEILRRALKDRSNEVRLTAALSLAELDATPPVSDVVETLFENSREHPLLLHRLFDRLAAYRPAEVLSVARGSSDKPFLRPIAVRALGRSGKLEVKDAVAALIEDPEPEVRAAALDAAASLGDLDAKDRIKKALKDPVQFVRIRAIDAARRLDLRDLGPEILELLEDENWWVRFRAGETLAAFGHPIPEGERKVIDLVTAARAAGAQRGAA